MPIANDSFCLTTDTADEQDGQEMYKINGISQELELESDTEN